MKTIVIIENEGTHAIEDENKLTAAKALKELGLSIKDYKVIDTSEAKTRISYTVVSKQPKKEHSEADISPIGETPEPKSGTTVPLPEADEPPKHIILNRSEFEEILKIALDFIPKKATMPALLCVRINFDGERGTLYVSDLETWWTKDFAVKNGNNAAICVNLSVLYKEVKALPKDEGDVTLTITKGTVSVASRAAILSTDPEEFPEIPTVIEERRANVLDLSVKLKTVFPAISRDETRYVLTGAYFDFTQGKLVATDGYRLHIESIAAVDTKPLLVPRQSAAILCKYPSDGTFVIGERHASIDLAGGTMTFRFIEGLYPDHKTVFPETTERLTFKRSDFLSVLDGADPLAFNHIVSLVPGEDLAINSESDAGTYEWRISCNKAGDPPEMSFNIQFLRDALNSYPHETIDLRCAATYGGVVINDNAIVMPIRR